MPREGKKERIITRFSENAKKIPKKGSGYGKEGKVVENKRKGGNQGKLHLAYLKREPLRQKQNHCGEKTDEKRMR